MGVSVFTAVWTSTATASADPSDDAAFLRALHKQGITAKGGDPQEMIKLGHMLCDLRGKGYSENSLVSMGKLYGNDMSDQDVKVIVTSAEAAYCPEYIG
jgi:hypothetical protein